MVLGCRLGRGGMCIGSTFATGRMVRSGSLGGGTQEEPCAHARSETRQRQKKGEKKAHHVRTGG
ncbi:hypothetical protein Rsph17029_2984 [Rhodobacter sphaeroides ATCC 17029]|nr:hypothetical protein Rsph17029_2984 [Cereibacter sphaeroides ATCC 17029]